MRFERLSKVGAEEGAHPNGQSATSSNSVFLQVVDDLPRQTSRDFLGNLRVREVARLRLRHDCYFDRNGFCPAVFVISTELLQQTDIDLADHLERAVGLRDLPLENADEFLQGRDRQAADRNVSTFEERGTYAISRFIVVVAANGARDILVSGTYRALVGHVVILFP